VAETVGHWFNNALEVAGEVLTMKQLLAAYEETGQKLQEKQLGSVETLKLGLSRKTVGKFPVEYIPNSTSTDGIWQNKTDNIKIATNIKPLTVRQYLEQTNT